MEMNYGRCVIVYIRLDVRREMCSTASDIDLSAEGRQNAGGGWKWE